MSELSPEWIAGILYVTVGVVTFFVFLVCHIRNGVAEGRSQLHWTLTLIRWLAYSPLLWPLLWPTLIRFLRHRAREVPNEPG